MPFFRLFIYGLFAALLALLLELLVWAAVPPAVFLPLFSPEQVALSLSLVTLIVALAIIEESAKVTFLFRFFSAHPPALPFSGNTFFISALAFGAGFAALEVVPIMIMEPGTWFFLGNLAFHALSGFVYLRSFCAPPSSRKSAVIGALAALVALHVLYNAFILSR